jgi:amidohydrolase
MLLFQPSEECEQSGARCMVENGVTGEADYAVTIHCGNEHPTGYLGVVSGDYLAACDPITITFHGKTAHATLPEQGVDAIQMALKAQAGMKQIVEEEAGDRLYIWSLGYFHAGTAHNVICDHAEIKISFRYYDLAFAARVRERCMALCEQVAAEIGGTVEFNWVMSAPPLHNKDFLVQQFKKSIAKLEGVGLEELTIRKSTEDFAWLLQDKPGFLFRYGSGNEKKGCTTLAHCNDFMPDEDGFRYGVLAFVQFVLDAAELP